MNRVVTWILILGALGLVLALFAFAFYRNISGGAILAFILCSFVIGGSTSAACYALVDRLSRYSDLVHLSVNLMVASVIGIALSSALILLIVRYFDPSVEVPLLPYVLATTVLSLVITTVTTIVERRIGLLTPLLPPQESVRESPKALSLREGVNHFIVPFREIIYLSSADDRTVVHTETREYVTVRPMKDVLATLPPEMFLRVHKSYSVNLNFILRLEYVMGGQLMAHLSDGEATSLNVGRTYADGLKRRFGLLS